MKNKRFLSVPFAIAVIAITFSAFLCLPSMTVSAATITVTTNADSGTGSLRNAIGLAVNSGDIISFDIAAFPADGETTITLTSALPSVANNVTIQGHLRTSGAYAGRPAVSIVRSTAGGTPNFRILSASGGITLSGLELRNGKTTGSGGGVYAAASVTATNCRFLGNMTETNGSGGGVFAETSVTATNCYFESNTTGTTGSGGGAYTFSGDLTVTDCTFYNNISAYAGGGVCSGNAVIAENCTFTDNMSTYDSGGGVFATTSVTATGCDFVENYANINTSNGGGGIYAHTRFVSATGCTFTGNTAKRGGGIYAHTAVNAINCDFTENRASGADNSGGGVYSYTGDVTAANCTFTDNEANRGGGVFASGFVTATSCDFIGNKGSGVNSAGGGVYSGTSAIATDCDFKENLVGDKNGGGMYVSETLTATNCTFTSNFAVNGGGAAAGRLILKNCMFKANSSGNGGGAYTIEAVNAENCTFEGNSAASIGGGVRADVSFTGKNCVFTNNTSATYGGGVNSGAVAIESCTFTGNASNNASNGGGVFATSINATSCTFTNNMANSGGCGGGMYADTSITAASCTFKNNKADAHGGGAYASNSLRVTDCTFTNNTATFVGGGVYGGISPLFATRCTFTGNTASDGGGIWATNSAAATGCAFTNNTAADYGGGLHVSTVSTMTNCTVTNNKAGNGGGMYANTSITATNCVFTGNRTTRGHSGTIESRALYLYHSTVAKNTGNGVYCYTDSVSIPPAFYAYNSIISGNGSPQARYGNGSITYPYTGTTGGASRIEGIGGVTHAAVFGNNVPDAAGIIKPLSGGIADKSATALTAVGITVPSGVTAASVIATLSKDVTGVARNSVGAVNYGAVEATSVLITGITIGNAVTNMVVGNTRTLKANITPANVPNKAVTWSSSDAKIAKVDQTGKVTAVSAGKVTIKATAKDGSGKSGSVAVTVHQYVTMRVGKTTAIQNGKKTTIDDVGTKPFKISGKTMLPLRFVGEKMGGTVKYINDNQPITMSYGNTKVEFRLGNKQMKVIKGSTTTIIILDVAAQKKSGKTYIPVRAISQALGFQVYYEAGTEYIVVNNPKMTDAVRNERLAEAKKVIK